MQGYRFGKHPPKTDYRTLRFRDYVTAELAPPPAAFNVLDRVYGNLHKTDPAELFPMDGNDRLGDCTIAALAHAITVYRGLVEKRRIMPERSVTKLYMHLTGGIDSGLNELDVLNYWRKHSVSGDKFSHSPGSTPKTIFTSSRRSSIFGGVYLGFQVQQNCVEQFNAHQPWIPGRLTEDGHAVFAVGYDQNAVTVLTWGNTQQGTWAWWDECVDEAYAIVPPEAKDHRFDGFDIAELENDLNAVAS